MTTHQPFLFNPLWLTSSHHLQTMVSDIHFSKHPFFITHYISFSHSEEELKVFKTLVSQSFVVTHCTLPCFQPDAFYWSEGLLWKTNTRNIKRLFRNLSSSQITLKVLLKKHSSFRQQYTELLQFSSKGIYDIRLPTRPTTSKNWDALSSAPI